MVMTKSRLPRTTPSGGGGLTFAAPGCAKPGDREAWAGAGLSPPAGATDALLPGTFHAGGKPATSPTVPCPGPTPPNGNPGPALTSDTGGGSLVVGLIGTSRGIPASAGLALPIPVLPAPGPPTPDKLLTGLIGSGLNGAG